MENKNKITIGRLNEATAILFVGIGLLNGYVAHNYDAEADRVEGAKQVYLSQGNNQQAAELSAYGDRKENSRDIYLGLTAVNLSLATVFGSLGASMIKRGRRDGQRRQSRSSEITSES